LLLVLLAAAAPVAASAEARHPALALVSRAPLTVRGAEFRPREAVHVSFSAGGQTKVVFVRATRTGTFVASADVPVSRCSALRIVAVGMLGSTAVAHLPQPACIPARAPGANP
jgi:hypothetical protein